MNQISESITSRQNPRIKNLVRLQKHSERIKQQVVVIEGIKEIQKSLLAGYTIESVFFHPQLIDRDSVAKLFRSALPEKIFSVTDDVYKKIAYRENSGGLIVIAEAKGHTIQSLVLPENPLILVIEGLEKPGNLGAIYRTAEAAGIDAVIICNPKTDLYNPNAIRASLGCVFIMPTAMTTSPEAIKWLKDQNIRIYCTSLTATVPYHTVDFTKPSAIVMGTEATGISDVWLEESHAHIIIPMRGKTDSMNVSVSTAVIIFEACRQRNLI